MFWHYAKLVLKVVGFLLVVGACGLVVITKLSGGKFLSVQSNSMVPTFSRGALVIVTPIPTKQLAVGKIVNFIDPNNSRLTLTHRIVQTPNALNDYKFVTKGDSNKAPDPPISPKAIIGRESLAIPDVGYLTDFVSQPLGLILLIYVPALVIIVEEVLRLAAYYRSIQPYIAYGYLPKSFNSSSGHRWLAKAGIISLFAVITSAFFTVPAQAALQGHATLTNITISTAVVKLPPTITSTCNNNTNININNSSDQSGSSGSVDSSGNSVGETITSGSINESNSTSVNITINNC
jgi:signal peptidase I